MKAPTRPPAPERPLTSRELEEFALVVCTTGNAPLLDGLLFEFHRRTAACREGALNLRICDLDARGGAVTLTEKFGRSRRLPLDAHTTWSGILDVDIHWSRHTALGDVRTVADERTAHNGAGHAAASGSIINAYTKVPFEGLAAADEAICGPRLAP